MCLDLPVPTNGVITYSPDTTSPYDYRTVATYSCLDGYGLAGGDKTRECLGMWTGIAPTCERKYTAKWDCTFRAFELKTWNLIKTEWLSV